MKSIQIKDKNHLFKRSFLLRCNKNNDNSKEKLPQYGNLSGFAISQSQAKNDKSNDFINSLRVNKIKSFIIDEKLKTKTLHLLQKIRINDDRKSLDKLKNVNYNMYKPKLNKSININNKTKEKLSEEVLNLSAFNLFKTNNNITDIFFIPKQQKQNTSDFKNKNLEKKLANNVTFNNIKYDGLKSFEIPHLPKNNLLSKSNSENMLYHIRKMENSVLAGEKCPSKSNLPKIVIKKPNVPLIVNEYDKIKPMGEKYSPYDFVYPVHSKVKRNEFGANYMY